MRSMMCIEKVSELIRAGKPLLVSGDEKLLSALPTGCWVGATTPYFMTEEGGQFTRDQLQVVALPDCVTDITVKLYDAVELPRIADDYKPNGFGYIVIPAFSKVHELFAQDCSTWRGIFNRPLVGWVAGIDLKDLGKATPKVFNGQTGEMTDAKAAVLLADLPPGKYASAEIVNLFHPGDGDIITFPQEGFEATDCFVNGSRTSFAGYLQAHHVDTQLPLVADYMGAMVNVSFQSVDAEHDKVAFYAPVFPGVEYKVARPVGSYEAEFCKHLNEKGPEPLFTCNCILNYLYAHLEGKKTGSMVGPITFGEIAYMLLNQTLVYLTVQSA